MTDTDKSVPELKEELKDKGLSTEGKKDELVARVRGANEGEPGTRGIRGDEPQYMAPE